MGTTLKKGLPASDIPKGPNVSIKIPVRLIWPRGNQLGIARVCSPSPQLLGSRNIWLNPLNKQQFMFGPLPQPLCQNYNPCKMYGLKVSIEKVKGSTKLHFISRNSSARLHLISWKCSSKLRFIWQNCSAKLRFIWRNCPAK